VFHLNIFELNVDGLTTAKAVENHSKKLAKLRETS